MIDTTNMSIMANLIQPSSGTIASQMISNKDSDSDSNLSIDELGVSEEFFSSIDTDGDGLASSSELTTAIDTAMAQFDGEMPTKEEFQSVLASFGFEAPESLNSSSNSLSESQLETISSILENYDVDNLSQSDAQEIIAAFQDAGIEPSAELEAAMEEEGFSAQELGVLADTGSTSVAAAQGGGGGGGTASSESEEEEYDVMDTNEDGYVSLEEMQEYYGTTSESSSQSISASDQNALDNLQFLMEALKANSEDEENVNSKNFDGLLKTINNQNNNSEVNTYLQNNNPSSMFSYA